MLLHPEVPDGLGPHQRSGQVGGEGLLPPGYVDVDDRPGIWVSRRVIDQYIDCPKSLHGAVQHPLHVLAFSHVAGHPGQVATRRGPEVFDRGRTGLLVAAGDHHLGPGLRHGRSNAATDSSRATGDDGDFAVQSDVHGRRP